MARDGNPSSGRTLYFASLWNINYLRNFIGGIQRPHCDRQNVVIFFEMNTKACQPPKFTYHQSFIHFMKRKGLESEPWDTFYVMTNFLNGSGK